MVIVSVIISAYNAAFFIEETVNSVLNQSYKDLELILVDDGSTDNTVELVKKIALQDNRLKIYTKPNTGSASTKNYGFGKSICGKYVAFIDADDVWYKENLSKCVQFLEEHPDCALVYTVGQVIDEHSRPVPNKYDYNRANLELDDILSWKAGSIPCPSSTLFRRDVYSLIGGWDSVLDMCLDQDIYMRIAKKHKLGYIDEVLYYYRKHANNFSKNVIRMETDHIKTFKKAKMNKYFKSRIFEHYCFANLYLILAASWWVNGNNKLKGIHFAIKSFFTYPPLILSKTASKIYAYLK